MKWKEERGRSMNEMYYWSPGVQFCVKEGELYVERFRYGKQAAQFFPEFYYVAQNGVQIEDLGKRFMTEYKSLLMNLIRDFIKKKILVSSVITPKELFHSQTRLFHNDYPETIRFVSEELENFKKEQSRRELVKDGLTYILEDAEYSSDVVSRESVRKFSKEAVSFHAFSRILGCLQNREGRKNTRYYPSAGGLFPVDIYIFVKQERVEGVEQGLYYYNPVINGITFVDSGEKVTSEAQFITNREIFTGSAFTMYFLYNARCSMPKYSGMGYYYGILDCGIMIGLITRTSEEEGISTCSIGDMEFDKIESCFHHNKNQLFLHSMELGFKDKSERKQLKEN